VSQRTFGKDAPAGKDYGSLARNWIDAVRKDMNLPNFSGRRWGIYARYERYVINIDKIQKSFQFVFCTVNPLSPHSWNTIFGDPNVIVAPDLPLWVSQVNKPLDPHLETYKPFGGWEFATIRQWNISTDSNRPNPARPCGGDVDQDTFKFQLEIPSHKQGPQTCKTTADGLRYRTCQTTKPSTGPNCVAMGQFPLGKMVSFTCKTEGQPINGDWNTKYDDQRDVMCIVPS
jgi:hypothetical protein